MLSLKGSMVANVSFLYPINAMYGMNCSKQCLTVYASNSNDRAELFKPNLTKCSRECTGLPYAH